MPHFRASVLLCLLPVFLALAAFAQSPSDAPAALDRAVLISPAPGAPLSGDTVTFHWNPAPQASSYWLDVGSTPSGHEFFQSANLGYAVSATVTGLPTDGSLVYVTLYSYVGDHWLDQPYTYAAAGGRFTFIKAVGGPGCSLASVCSATIKVAKAGHLLVVDTWAGIELGSTLGGFSCSAGKTKLTNTPSSPYTFLSPTDHGNAGLAYLLSAPAGLSKITCRWTENGSTGFVYTTVHIMEFAYTGTLALDHDATATWSLNTGFSPFVTPCLTPTNTRSLMVGEWITDLGAQSGALAPWTTVTATNANAYILSSPAGQTCANFVDSVSPDSAGVVIADFH